MANEAISRLNNILCRTIILLQLKELALRIDVLKVKNVIDVRTTKTINALRIVAHHTDVLLLTGELRNNLLLHGVGVLKLIDQHIAEARSIFLPDVFVFMKQLPGEHQQIVEIHCIGLHTSLLINLIDFIKIALLIHVVALAQIHTRGIIAGRNKMVLGHADAGVHRRWFIDFLIKTKLLGDIFDQRTTIRLVVNGEIALIAHMLGLDTQDARKDAVEGAHVKIVRTILVHHSGNALTHFARRFVGER